MTYYTVYYTVPFYPYKSLIYNCFSASRFSVNPMPAFSNLSKEEIRLLVDWILTIKEGPPS
jgi:hypothetical protein